jgi:hypothetical protein
VEGRLRPPGEGIAWIFPATYLVFAFFLTHGCPKQIVFRIGNQFGKGFWGCPRRFPREG